MGVNLFFDDRKPAGSKRPDYKGNGDIDRATAEYIAERLKAGDEKIEVEVVGWKQQGRNGAYQSLRLEIPWKIRKEREGGDDRGGRDDRRDDRRDPPREERRTYRDDDRQRSFDDRRDDRRDERSARRDDDDRGRDRDRDRGRGEDDRRPARDDRRDDRRDPPREDRRPTRDLDDDIPF